MVAVRASGELPGGANRWEVGRWHYLVGHGGGWLGA